MKAYYNISSSIPWYILPAACYILIWDKYYNISSSIPWYILPAACYILIWDKNLLHLPKTPLKAKLRHATGCNSCFPIGSLHFWSCCSIDYEGFRLSQRRAACSARGHHSPSSRSALLVPCSSSSEPLWGPMR